MQISIPQLDPGQRRQRTAQDREIQNYTLVGDKGFLSYIKLMVGVLLAVWNAHLFVTTIPGWMGYFTAFVAINLEGLALYCVHNYTRSINNHKQWLGRFAVILGTFSLTHAVFAIVSYTGYADGVKFVEFYSNVLALPIIVILLSVTVATLTMTHWKAAIMKALAFSKIESLKNRAQVLMEQHRLLDAQELMMLKAGLFKSETDIKQQLVPIVMQRIAVGEQLARLVDGIKDGDVRREVSRELDNLTGNTRQLNP